MELRLGDTIRVIKPTPQERVHRLISGVKEVCAIDVSHDDLGKPSGFHAAEAKKNELCEYLLSVLDAALPVADDFNPPVLDANLQQIDGITSYLRSLKKNIDELVERGIHNTSFPNERQSIIDGLEQNKNHWQTVLFPFENAVRLARAERTLATNEALITLRREAAEQLEQIKKATSDAAKILDNVRDRVMAKGLAEASDTFRDLAAAHASREFIWLCVFIVASGLTVWAVLHAAIAVGDVTQPPRLIQTIVQRLLIISTSAAFMKLALGKHNLERNLRIIYDHRDTVLRQYRVFESAIGEDADSRAAKNQFRLEIAKYIFADPVTGYVSHNAGSDITINPVVSTIEKFASKSG